ncbi:hypothetical protein GAGA_1934 [Paraglaciecola agarilytica NO2]|uniref:Uncharacterized protein n=1 Tax=Paraglaciecola agarilytica NO2 TaxID=1125747 RepID=A0ABQ0I610_9ALTE|nr:hypothetical protein GAGA_1934 [Paraglaciecola agarilytica NO2]
MRLGRVKRPNLFYLHTKNFFVVGGIKALELKKLYLQYPALPY